MIIDKYQLSRIYSKQSISENVVQEVQEDKVENLPELVQRLLYELKFTVIEESLEELQQVLKDAKERGDEQLIVKIMTDQNPLIALRQEICRALGNRVILR